MYKSYLPEKSINQNYDQMKIIYALTLIRGDFTVPMISIIFDNSRITSIKMPRQVSATP